MCEKLKNNRSTDTFITNFRNQKFNLIIKTDLIFFFGLFACYIVIKELYSYTNEVYVKELGFYVRGMQGEREKITYSNI